MFMATKTITIMDDAYELLARAKLPEESFSDTIRRVIGEDDDIERFFGCWSDEFAESVKKNIEERRAYNRNRAKRRDDLFIA